MHAIYILVGIAALAIGLPVAHWASDNVTQTGWRGYILALAGWLVLAVAAIVIALCGIRWNYLWAFGYLAVVFTGLNIYEKYVRTH